MRRYHGQGDGIVADDAVALTPERRQTLGELAGRLGCPAVDPGLLHQALVHRSHVNEHRKDAPPESDNERLEFLGDAVLGLAVSEELFQRFPAHPEGLLARFKSQLVSETTLAGVAGGFELGNYLWMSKGEEATGGRERASLLADAMEAVLAAVYLSLGFGEIQKLIRRVLEEQFAGLEADGPATGDRSAFLDAKSALQELTQQSSGERPVYRIIKESGPDHQKSFVVEVSLAGVVLGLGEGGSKKEAQQIAAGKALERLQAHTPLAPCQPARLPFPERKHDPPQ